MTESSAAPRPRRRRRGLAEPALVFFTSAAVLVLEILAGRLVAPYVGVSLETYTGIIGTVLAGIAVGSALGGRAADRHDPRTLIGPLLIAAGGASLAVLPVISTIGPLVSTGGAGPAGIVTLAVTAFVLPTALLSAIPPMAAKLRLGSTAETGSVVGGLSAAGTAGALVGTFATGFVFVAALPTRRIVTAVGVALVVTGVGVSYRLRRRVHAGAAAGLLVLAAVAQGIPSPCGEETRYFCVTVLADPLRASGRTLVLDNVPNSYVDLADPTHLEFRYARLLAAVVDATLGAGPLSALHVGGGGFTLPRWLAATRPGSTSTVLELDPGVVAVARRELGLRVTRDLRIRTGDARLAVRDEPPARYGVVFGDAFSGRSVPWHLTTVEMLRDLRRTMRDDGVYVLNMIDGGDRGLVRAELATLAAVFDRVAVVVPPDGTYGNYVLAASDRALALGGVAPDDGRALVGAALTRFVGDARPLRDDHAPVDQLMTTR